MNYPIVPMPPDLWPAVCGIYREGIATGNATFETEVPDWEKWDRSHRNDCRLVALEPRDEVVAEVLVPLEEATVLGWAALSPVSIRLVYGGVAEVSVYVAAAARRRGVGKALLQALVKRHLDTPGRCLPRERCEYFHAQVLRISGGGTEAPHRKTGRHLERCDLA